jgi:hypothetical protein
MVGAWCCGSIDGPTLMMHTGMIGCYDRGHPAKHINKLTLVARFASTPPTEIAAVSLCTIARFRVRTELSLAPRFPFSFAATAAARRRTFSPNNCESVDATKPQHGHGSSRRLPATSTPSGAPYSRCRHGPSWHSLAGGLHQPAADAPGQSQQASPAAWRIRSAPCL